MASTSRIFARNWLPSPSPFDAPLTNPAMSTNVIRVGITCFELAILAKVSSRASGTATSPTFGSMVQNGKFAACAAAVLVNALNKVDLPTFGNPTIPILNPMALLLLALLRASSDRSARRQAAKMQKPRCDLRFLFQHKLFREMFAWH